MLSSNHNRQYSYAAFQSAHVEAIRMLAKFFFPSSGASNAGDGLETNSFATWPRCLWALLSAKASCILDPLQWHRTSLHVLILFFDILVSLGIIILLRWPINARVIFACAYMFFCRMGSGFLLFLVTVLVTSMTSSSDANNVKPLLGHWSPRGRPYDLYKLKGFFMFLRWRLGNASCFSFVPFFQRPAIFSSFSFCLSFFKTCSRR